MTYESLLSEDRKERKGGQPCIKLTFFIVIGALPEHWPYAVSLSLSRVQATRRRIIFKKKGRKNTQREMEKGGRQGKLRGRGKKVYGTHARTRLPANRLGCASERR
jgi:hypothetical protein